jgi:DNA modification methylase
MELNTILQGDCLQVLKTLPSESVDCVVTSPPYWALRDYGVEGQLGLEPTFQEYITKLCDIFDEVKRVLKKSGTCWVNMGDTYYGVGNNRGNTKTLSEIQKGNRGAQGQVQQKWDFSSYPAKSLCMIPSRFAIEMSNRGWILRNEIIWHKPNCMPSGVKDRFTVDFEKVFFFVKNKKYWFETQYEPHTRLWDARNGGNMADVGHKKNGKIEAKNTHPNGYPLPNHLGRNKRTVWRVATKPFREAHFATYPEALIEPMIKAGCPLDGVVLDPFIGSGTTGLVAKKQGKNYIGIELNPKYIEMAEKRIKSVPERLL